MTCSFQKPTNSSAIIPRIMYETIVSRVWGSLRSFPNHIEQSRTSGVYPRLRSGESSVGARIQENGWLTVPRLRARASDPDLWDVPAALSPLPPWGLTVGRSRRRTRGEKSRLKYHLRRWSATCPRGQDAQNDIHRFRPPLGRLAQEVEQWEQAHGERGIDQRSDQ